MTQPKLSRAERKAQIAAWDAEGAAEMKRWLAAIDAAKGARSMKGNSVDHSLQYSWVKCGLPQCTREHQWVRRVGRAHRERVV